MAPRALEYVAAAQREHTVLPVRDWYLPAEHKEQSPCPETKPEPVAYVPWRQSRHWPMALAPEPDENLPAEHMTHVAVIGMPTPVE